METEAHGKVLLLGGYLVLYPRYYGVVASCSAKIKCFLEVLGTSQGNINVVSNRFSINAVFKQQPFEVKSETNPFITEAIKTSLYFISLSQTLPPDDIKLTINADEAFYLSGKTGLGSSAALITVIVSSMLKYSKINNQQFLHFVAQVANFRAQQKIGSGFDVSAAVYGSHLFTRYQSCLALALVDHFSTSLEAVLDEIAAWPVPTTFKIPTNYHVVLSCMDNVGSDTRILVKELINWLEKDKNIEILDRIHFFTERFVELLDLQDKFKLKQLSKDYKIVLQELSQRSGVPVLPNEIKDLLDNIESTLDDVVFSAVPGAGGYDAFYFIVLKSTWEEAKNYVGSHFPGLTILNVHNS
jgi:phosphomevalonate kinase